MNLDLPQFDPEKPGGWAEISTAFDVAGLAFGPPLAIQVFNREGVRALVTGVVSGTEDQFPFDDTTNEHPTRSTIYFQDADMIEIEWAKVGAVLAMVAYAEGPPAERIDVDVNE